MGKSSFRGGFPKNISLSRHRRCGKSRKPLNILLEVQRITDRLKIHKPKILYVETFKDLFKSNKY